MSSSRWTWTATNANQDGEWEIVAEEVMVLAPPEEWMRRVPREELGDDSHAVEVRRNAREDGDSALPVREPRGSFREAPARQGMRNRVQGPRLSPARFRRRPGAAPERAEI